MRDSVKDCRRVVVAEPRRSFFACWGCPSAPLQPFGGAESSFEHPRAELPEASSLSSLRQADSASPKGCSTCALLFRPERAEGD